MAILGIVLLLIVPYLLGIAIEDSLREETASHLKVYVTGFLSLFALFLLTHLVGLKKDWDLSELEKYYFFFIILIMVYEGAFKIIKKKKNIKLKISLDKRSLYVVIPAILLAAYSYFYLAPSYLNDDTWEVVSTTLAHRSIYEYSAMTGKLMEAGLPIFNKIYVMPMFYTCMCDAFKIPMWVIAGFIMPLMIYCMNLLLVNEIGKKAGVKNREAFLIIYMIFMMAGTYLPVNGIPVTVGYAVLREGYSGYAIAYGVAIPFIVLLLSEKKYIYAGFMSISVLGLVRLDRIFFALKDGINSFHQINEAGKLFGIYLIAVIAAIVLLAVKNKKTPEFLFFVPGALCAYEAENIKEYIVGRKKQYLYLIAVSLLIFSASSFDMYSDGVTLKSTFKSEKQVKERLNELKEEYGDDLTIWGSDDFMAVARRVDGNVKTLYGRDDITTDYMIGLDYEDPGYAMDYYYSYLNMHDRNPHFFPSSLEVDEAIEKAYEEGTTVLVE